MIDTLLFIDPTTPRPYDPACMEGRGIGGTEQTMECLAEGFALRHKEQLKVVVEQHNRLEAESYQANALYTSLGATKKAKWVVVLRDPREMLKARARFPDAKIYLYSHDLADRNLALCMEAGIFKDSGCIANICVSDWHRTQTLTTLKPFGYSGEFKMRFIYNPISPNAVRDPSIAYDPNKLVWLASPHKGLAQAYSLFKHLLRQNPEFKLYVTNPGYFEDCYANDPEVKDRTIVLGTLPHTDALQHLRNSLCLFYPNTVFPETFGKIMAEANSVGTPVLTSTLGASREVLDKHPGQICDCSNVEQVVKRIMHWHKGERPIVRGNPQFKLSNVITQWENLLNDIR